MATSVNGTVVDVQDLRKYYGQTRAVDGLSFIVEKGEIFGMLGPNGAGKTTTVEVLVGIRRRDSGTVSVLGMDPERQPTAVKDRIGVQLQTASMYPRLTVYEVVRLFCSFYSRCLEPAEVINRVELQEKARTQIKNLSGGQMQRLAIALAMVNDGDLVFLDEPTTGLDPQARRNLWDVVFSLKKSGKTVFLTTHYMDEAERLCDRVAVIDYGKIIAIGSPHDLIKDHFLERAVEFVQPALAGDARLSGLPGVTRVRGNGDRVTLYTTEVPATIAGLMELSEASGTPIKDITVRQATLEDVFLKLTGRRIRE
ncbi:MAG: ABC transporter ATP-binding protein [Bacillota bacterium]